jgi:hypothetical protein
MAVGDVGDAVTVKGSVRGGFQLDGIADYVRRFYGKKLQNALGAVREGDQQDSCGVGGLYRAEESAREVGEQRNARVSLRSLLWNVRDGGRRRG